MGARNTGEEATREPRWGKTDFKHHMFKKVCRETGYMIMDLMTMQKAMNGSRGKPDRLFDDIKAIAPKEFQAANGLVMHALEDLRTCTLAVLKHEIPAKFDMQHLLDLHHLTSLSGNEVTRDLITAITDHYQKILESPNIPETMEDDDICRVSVILCMLGNMTDHASKATAWVVENL